MADPISSQISAMFWSKRFLSRAELEQLAEEFQPQLLALRLANYWRSVAVAPKVDALEHLSPRIRDVGRTLGLTFLAGQGVDEEILQILARSDRDARAQRHSESEWVVTTALLDLAHKGKVDVSVGEIADQANDVLAMQGGNNPTVAEEDRSCPGAARLRNQAKGKLGARPRADEGRGEADPRTGGDVGCYAG